MQMKISDLARAEYLAKWEGKSDEEKRLSAIASLGTDGARRNFPELFQTDIQKEISQPKKSDKVRVLTRAIGRVRWYNGQNARTCGIAMINNFGTPEAETKPNTFMEVEILRGAWKDDGEPNEGQWIIFSLKCVHGHYIATKSRRLDGAEESFNVALQYIGAFSKISGSVVERRHGRISYDDSILSKAITLVKKDHPEEWMSIVRTRVNNYLSRLSEECREKRIDALLSDTRNAESLREIYLPREAFTIDEGDEITGSLQCAFANRVLASGSFSEIEKIPTWYHISITPEEAKRFLETANSEKDAKQFLSVLDSDSFSKVCGDPNEAISWPRRITLWEVTNNADWIRKAVATCGEEVKQWIHIANVHDVCELIWCCSDGTEDDGLTQILDDQSLTENGLLSGERLKEIVRHFCEDVEGRFQRTTLLNRVVDACVGAKQLENWCLLLSAGIDLTSSYEKLVQRLNDSADGGWEDLRILCDEIYKDGDDAKIVQLILDLSNVSQSLLGALFAISGIDVFGDNITDVPALIEWLQKRTPEQLLEFLRKYESRVDKDSESDPIALGIGPDKMAEAIRLLPKDERYPLLMAFPNDDVLRVVWNQFQNDPLFELCVGEIWKAEKAKVPYVTFDLESDGENIREFGFRSEGNTRGGDGEEQIDMLKRALSSHSIVVGHNIKKWDLPILVKKGITTESFVWDTLEIEILLNPCRYAYALHTEHHAKSDAELTDKLFWDQLHRLSKRSELCKRFSEMFPQNINEVLNKLQKPWFAELFKREAKNAKDFFQTPGELDAKIIEQLEKINTIVGTKTALIIAPRELWGHVAQHVSVSFLEESQCFEYCPLDARKIEAYKFQSPLEKAIIERYVDNVKTPIPANLAQYLRLNVFHDEMLSKLVSPANLKVCCVDADELENAFDKGPYDYIFKIGTELVNRLHQYRIPYDLDASELIGEKCWIPMRVAAAGFVAATDEDRYLMSSFASFEVLQKAQNVWAERRGNGKFSICYCIDFESALSKLTESMPSAEVHEIAWNRMSSIGETSFNLVTSGFDDSTFDPREIRVTSVSPSKASYWAYQFKLLDAIRNNAAARPIVYVVDDEIEIPVVHDLAIKKGYQIPPQIGLSAMQNWMARRNNSLMVICRDDLTQFLALRSDVAFSVVFDRMSVEKCMTMWKGMTFGDEARLVGASDIGNSGLRHEGTPRDAMLSAWPMFVHYHRLILANNAQSVVYLLDPYLDDYPELADSWHTGVMAATMWHDKDAFQTDLSLAREVIPEESQTETKHSHEEITAAMEVIKEMLLPEDAEWRDYQKPVLEKILSKETDLVISIPTGGGKSVLFQGPALYQSMRTNRLSIVITPLKALMEDQIIGLREHGFMTNVEYLNSDRSYFETRQIYRRIGGGDISLLYVTPERFRSKAFINALDRRIANDNGLEYFIFDEAHCVSQWGQEFRPDYLHVMDWCRKLKESHPTTCATFYSATMTGLIENDIRAYIKDVQRVGLPEKDYNPIRKHISMSFREVGMADKEHYKAIQEYIAEKKIDVTQSLMLVFCLMRHQCEDAAEALRPELREMLGRTDADPSPIDYFHGGMDGDEREEMLNVFRNGDTPYLCATKAFGMGIDIPNIHYIIHYSPPRVLEDYLQEVGRAGRKEELYRKLGFGENNPLPAVCLYSRDDFRKHADKLKTGELTWSDLAELHNRILDFAKELQCLERMQDVPIVIPTNFWSKGGDGDVTSLRLGLHWLERLRRIRLGFTRPACVCINILKDEFEEPHQVHNVFGARRVRGTVANERDKAVYERVKQISAQRGNKRIQVQLSELRVKGKVTGRQVMDALVSCSKSEVLDIEQSVHCAISVYRDSETRYAIQKEENHQHVALHWVFELAKSALAVRRNANDEIVMDARREHDLLSKLREGSMSTLDVLIKTIEQNGKQVKKLPWFNEVDRMDNRGFVNPENYLEDFLKKRTQRMYELLALIPGASVRSFLKKGGSVSHIRGIDKQDGLAWLTQFEEDCWVLLENIARWPSQTIKWVDLMKQCGLTEKGFEYFSSATGFLSAMCYIETESMLPFGIEAYSTNRTNDPIVEPTDGQDEFPVWKSFDEVSSMRAVRLAAMAAFSRLHRDQYDNFIQQYFQCDSYESYLAFVQEYISSINDSNVVDEIMSLLTDKVLADDVGRLTVEQKAVYDAPLHTNINVLAGPGSGKTHVLTLRCARLIYKEGVAPDNILVLAYNRAVVVELKNRLEKLFRGLGLSSRASQLHVHTFHSLAKRICGDAVSAENMSDWEGKLVQELKTNPQAVFTRLSPTMQYVLIDEFQDITKTRLDAMDYLKKLFQGISFFVIGDKNQSIYGFERRSHGEPMSPEPYYQRFVRDYSPTEYLLRVNFRSYQDILDAAAVFIPNAIRHILPTAAPQIMANAPSGSHVEIIDNRISYPDKRNHWPRQFEAVVREARENGYSDVAVFFRTNAEVFRGFSRLRDLNLGDSTIRIQGTSGELWRSREVFAVIWYLKQNEQKPVVFKDELTRSDVRTAVKSMMDAHPNWDQFYLDLAFTLVLEALDGLEGESGEFTYADLADIVKATAERDDGQCYKIYARHKDGRIDQTHRLSIVLTTMHKVKGLEFDSVVITPSYAALPLNSDAPIETPLTASDMEDIEEERRLLFVAYTRAKEKLRVYKWKREYAIESAQRMQRSDARMGYRDKEDLDKLYLSYLASHTMFVNNEYIANTLKRNEPLTIESSVNTAGALRCFLRHGGRRVACLSRSSKIVHSINLDTPHPPWPNLSGIFVSDLLVWTYQDTLLFDCNHSTHFADYWCEEAKAQGYVYVVDFAGYAHPQQVQASIQQIPVRVLQPPASSQPHDVMEQAQNRLRQHREHPFEIGRSFPVRAMLRPEFKDVAMKLKHGDRLYFIHDENNCNDRNAIKAVNDMSEQIGFVAREYASQLSIEIQKGRKIVAQFNGSISDVRWGESMVAVIENTEEK